MNDALFRAPERAGAILRRIRAWLARYDAVVLTALGLVIGTKFVYDGVASL